MRILLVGGAGYVGARLHRRLAANPQNEVDVLDLGLLWPPHVPKPCDEWRDALKVHPILALSYDCVVWLATIHDMPEKEWPAWEDVTRRLMVEAPLLWESYAGRFVYFSSMRAETHPETLYGSRKLWFEQACSPQTLVIRPGTVWGGWHPDLPNRNHTAINRLLIEPQAKVTLPQYHVHMDQLLDITETAIKTGAHGIVQAASDLPWKVPELGIHPMTAYRKHYNVSPD